LAYKIVANVFHPFSDAFFAYSLASSTYPGKFLVISSSSPTNVIYATIKVCILAMALPSSAKFSPILPNYLSKAIPLNPDFSKSPLIVSF